MIAREGSNFIFGPYPSAKTINGVYYQSPEKLADGTTTANWYTTNAPEVLLYGSLLEAAPFIKNDPRLPIWAQLFQNAKDSILDNEWKESGTLGSIAIRTA